MHQDAAVYQNWVICFITEIAYSGLLLYKYALRKLIN